MLTMLFGAKAVLRLMVTGILLMFFGLLLMSW